METKKERGANRKLEKKREKRRAKRYQKIKNGVDLCMILTYFLAFLAAAFFQIWEQRRSA